jgi:acyl-CoA dehydrogenase
MALRAAEVSTQLHTMRSTVLESAREVAELHAQPGADEAMATVGWALRLNHVKLAASTMVATIVTDALHICGIAGYRQDTPYSLGRHLRDAHSAALMIGNDRINATNAAFYCVHKEE